MELLRELLRSDVAEMVVGDDAAMVDDDGTATHGLHLLHDVGGEEHHFVPSSILDDGADFFQLIGVQTRGGLVKDKHLGVVYQRLGKAYTLPVALGELADAFVAFGRQSHQLYHLLHTIVAVLHAIHPCGKAQELAHVHVSVKGVVFRQVAYLPAHGQRLLIDAVTTH